MEMSKSLIQRLKFIVRHDYANPNAKLVLTRQECRAILEHFKEPIHLMDIKISKHCTTCFNDDNEIVEAEFVVINKQGRDYQYFCRPDMAQWLDLFINSRSAVYGFIPYEIRRLKQFCS